MPSTAQERILQLLKTQGAMTAQQLGEQLAMTTMGARQHLGLLQEKQLIGTFDKKAGKGRPAKYWFLTGQGHEQFPDRHAELTVNMLENVRELFGEQGLEQLVARREQGQLERYQQALASCHSLEEQLHTLATLRSEEGYMAEVEYKGDGWLFTEHHCPICAAARHCQQFCAAELDIFKQCFGKHVTVERRQHMVGGDQRCAYFVTINHTPEELAAFSQQQGQK